MNYNYKDSIVDELLSKDENTFKTVNKHLRFYHPGLDEATCEQMLLEFKENLKLSSDVFLLRDDSCGPKNFLLSIRDANKFWHHKIECIENGYFKIPDSNLIINGIENVIKHFKLKNFVIGQIPPGNSLKYGVTRILHKIVQNDYFNLLLKVLKNTKCPQIDTKNSQGRTALHEACFRGSKMVEILLNNGASVQIRDNYGNTPLNICCMQGHYHLLDLLINDFNSNVNARSFESSLTALHTAAIHNHAQMCKTLVLKFGALLHLKTKQNKKALDLAISNSSHEAVKILENLEEEFASYSSHENWLHEDTKHEEAVVLLDSVGQKDGVFLVIKNDSHSNNFNLMFYHRNKLNNFEITYSRNGFKLGENGRVFATLVKLIDFHCKNKSNLTCILKSSLNKNGQIVNDLIRRNSRSKSKTSMPIQRIDSSICRNNSNNNFERNRNSLRSKEKGGFDSLNISAYDVEIKYKIGEGEFGNVYRGDYTDENRKTIPVAIKTFKQNKKLCYKDFLRESKIMSNLNHKYIVKFYGYCSEQQMIVLELVLMGSLNKFFKPNSAMITVEIMNLWCLQIADGMRYLESQSIIHRDLASRNILVASMHQVKITDFGMARKLEHTDFYRQETNLKIPYRWYPLESLEWSVFTNKSDIWSYGVLIWEIYNLGKIPYENLDSFEQVIDYLKRGSRLNCPISCSKGVYEMMLKCWRVQPYERPTFDFVYNYFIRNNEFKSIVQNIIK